MKKILFSLAALCGFATFAVAQTITVDIVDTTTPDGATAGFYAQIEDIQEGQQFSLDQEGIVDFQLSHNVRNNPGVYAEKAGADNLFFAPAAPDGDPTGLSDVIRASCAPGWGFKAQDDAAGWVVPFVWDEGTAVAPTYANPTLPLPDPNGGNPVPMTFTTADGYPFDWHSGNTFDASADCFTGSNCSIDFEAEVAANTLASYKHSCVMDGVSEIWYWANFGFGVGENRFNLLVARLYNAEGELLVTSDPFCMQLTDGGPENISYLAKFSVEGAAATDVLVIEQAGANPGWRGIVAWGETSSGGEMWATYAQDAEGFVDTGDWMGVINVSQGDWIFNFSLGGFIFMPEGFVQENGAWGFILNN